MARNRWPGSGATCLPVGIAVRAADKQESLVTGSAVYKRNDPWTCDPREGTQHLRGNGSFCFYYFVVFGEVTCVCRE